MRLRPPACPYLACLIKSATVSSEEVGLPSCCMSLPKTQKLGMLGTLY